MPPQEIKDLATGMTQNEKMGVAETKVLRAKVKAERATDNLPVLLLSRALHAKESIPCHFRFFATNSSPPLFKAKSNRPRDRRVVVF
jgi:hypothetical protein